MVISGQQDRILKQQWHYVRHTWQSFIALGHHPHHLNFIVPLSKVWLCSDNKYLLYLILCQSYMQGSDLLMTFLNAIYREILKSKQIY